MLFIAPSTSLAPSKPAFPRPSHNRLCYWAAIGPIFLLEHLALDTPWGQRGMKLLLAVLESSGGEGYDTSCSQREK